MNNQLLIIHDLSVRYGGGQEALSQIDFSIGRGEIVAVVGGSGSGKSTLLKCVIGMFLDGEFEISGQMMFKDSNMLAWTEADWNRVRGEEITMIFQNTDISLNPNRKIIKQIWEYAAAHGRRDKTEVKAQIVPLLKAVQLTDAERVLESYPFELSGGMLQRVSIAMSMFLNPDLILADEPTSALDVTVQAQVVRQIRDIRDRLGAAIIFVTHNMGVASYVADRIVVMEHGKIAEEGTRDQIIFHPAAAYTRRLLSAVPELEELHET